MTCVTIPDVIIMNVIGRGNLSRRIREWQPASVFVEHLLQLFPAAAHRKSRLMDEPAPISCSEQVSVKLRSSGYGRAVTLEIAVENVEIASRDMGQSSASQVTQSVPYVVGTGRFGPDLQATCKQILRAIQARMERV